jgi:hypothetical protein
MNKQTPKIDENDFEAVDRLAKSLTFRNTRPMNASERRDWELAKRAGRGRPKKAPGAKAVPTLITVEPKLLKLIDSQARKIGVSRSQFLADAAKAKLGLPAA